MVHSQTKCAIYLSEGQNIVIPIIMMCTKVLFLGCTEYNYQCLEICRECHLFLSNAMKM